MKQRGEILTTILVVVAVAGIAGALAGWKPLDWFRKKPPVAQLTQLQTELAVAQAVAEQARIAREAAVVAERAKLEEQVRSAQQDNLGTETALKKVPAEHRTAEVKLASSMAQRVSLKLTAAIGALPKEQQEAMIDLIQQALSDKQEEVDAAYAKLKERDAQFQVLTQERDQVKKEVVVLTQKVESTQAVVDKTEAKVIDKTNEVKAIAQKLSDEKGKSSSLSASMERILYVAAWVAGIWAFLVFVVPGLVKHLDSGPIKNGLRAVAGYATAPLLYHDASKKLADAPISTPQTHDTPDL